MNSTSETAEAAARRLIAGAGRAALGTSMEGRPYVSLVLSACDEDGAPLLLLSDLAQHSRNILADSRVSLLLDATAGEADPLTGERLSVLGSAAPYPDAAALARYVARHPSSALYAGFTDFRLYRVEIDKAQLVAGFGRIHWVDGAALRRPRGTV